ncbi:MAG: hypothetical protein ABH824_04880 [Nanoarchaeota archaeon]|nr:hypothetical protein [Nanoarchaeota archaeon]MBU1631772.1 hypothetical protein [Nanoarchaeota archaeon]MBU1876172.1 hypothetical protein [Nanoarchaeota archaeon]
MKKMWIVVIVLISLVILMFGLFQYLDFITHYDPVYEGDVGKVIAEQIREELLKGDEK